MATERVLADFAGTWRIERNITHAAGPPATFAGQAQWTPGPDGGLTYTETGRLQITGAAPMQAERTYFWAADLSVYFADGRFFHRVPTGGGAARHWCAPDDYRVVYDFDRWPDFDVAWHVTGPRKNYRMLTHYFRDGSA